MDADGVNAMGLLAGCEEALAAVKSERDRLRAFAQFVVTLDDPRAVDLRRSITLTEIIERAKAALGPVAGSPERSEDSGP